MATCKTLGAFDLERFFEIVAPGSGDLVSMIEAYFDESGSGQGSGFFCVAGYVFDKVRCQKLDHDWKASLDPFGLPYFRMSSCAHGNKPFDKLSAQQRDHVAREIIGHIQNHAICGFSTSISLEILDRHSKDDSDPFGSAYTLLCYMTLLGVKQWADDAGFGGEIAYFFEAGDQFESQANKLMKDIFVLPEERQAFRYSAHAFVDKRKVRPVQAADVLAWHMVTDCRRKAEGLGKRADFKELIKVPVLAREISDEQFADYRLFWSDLPQEEKDNFLAMRRLL